MDKDDELHFLQKEAKRLNESTGKLKGDELKNAFRRAEDAADEFSAIVDPDAGEPVSLMQKRANMLDDAIRFTVSGNPDVKVQTHDYRFRPDFGDNRPYWNNPSRVFTDFMASQLPMSEMQPGHVFRFVRAPFPLNEAATNSLIWQYHIFKTERVLHILHHDNTVREDLMVKQFGTARARKLLRRAERLQRDAAQ